MAILLIFLLSILNMYLTILEPNFLKVIMSGLTCASFGACCGVEFERWRNEK